MKNNNDTLLLTLLVLLGVCSVALRLLPHAPNFAPIGAFALFVGLYASKRSWFIAPFVVMLASDFLIGFYNWKIMLVVYFGFLIYMLIGRIVKYNKSFMTVMGGIFGAALLFYLTTNFAVWAFGSLYPRTFSGLILSYEMALPFFRNSLFSDLFYVGVFVGTYELAFKIFPILLQKTKSILCIRSVI